MANVDKLPVWLGDLSLSTCISWVHTFPDLNLDYDNELQSDQDPDEDDEHPDELTWMWRYWGTPVH